jgi:hypothetical protein
MSKMTFLRLEGVMMDVHFIISIVLPTSPDQYATIFLPISFLTCLSLLLMQLLFSINGVSYRIFMA